MLIAVIGENCAGQSTLAGAIRSALGGEIVTGRDYLRLAKSRTEAEALFRARLRGAAKGANLIYVISEEEQLALLPDGAIRVLVSADLDTIKARFRQRMRGSLPDPVARMLENKHGRFDGGTYDFRYDGAKGDPAALCAALRAFMEGPDRQEERV